MTVVYRNAGGALSGALLVEELPEGWVVKSWGAAKSKENLLTAAAYLGVVEIVFIAKPAPGG
jgi:hypothetical protein